eukprot:gene22306-39588_t
MFLWRALLHRINNAAGPYEMVGGSLADAVVYDCGRRKAWYVEDTPEDRIHDRFPDRPRLTLQVVGRVAGPLCSLRTASAGVFSNFIHPVLQYFPPNVRRPPGALHRRYLQLLANGRISRAEHPSSVWDDTPGVSRLHIKEAVWDDTPGVSRLHIKEAVWDDTPGVSRLHIKEAYILLDWADAGVVRALSFFLSHVEHAAATACGGGNGTVATAFDERIDPHFYSQVVDERAQRWLAEHACGGAAEATVERASMATDVDGNTEVSGAPSDPPPDFVWGG